MENPNALPDPYAMPAVESEEEISKRIENLLEDFTNKGLVGEQRLREGATLALGLLMGDHNGAALRLLTSALDDKTPT